MTNGSWQGTTDLTTCMINFDFQENRLAILSVPPKNVDPFYQV